MKTLTPTPTAESLKTVPLHEIARLIELHWPKVHFAAAPYVSAMGCLTTVNDSYGLDSGRSIVNYALCNMGSFTGPVARLIKVELRRRVK